MDTSTKTGIWIVATGVIVAFLYFGRAILAPFALAVFLFLVIEGFARAIDRRVGFVDRPVARIVAIVTVLAGFMGFLVLMARGVSQFGGQAGLYERKINGLIADAYGLFGLQSAPGLSDILFGETGQRLIGGVAATTGELSENLVLILIYVAFLFIAQSAWPKKLDAIFPDRASRQQVKRVGDAARRGIETYLWTQTVISLIITALTWVTLSILGVQNALFLSALIFVLNYIPTIGSIIAAFVPLLFALVQPEIPAWVPGAAPQDGYLYAALVFGAVSFWQFSIGNFVQPRMMGESLNLSALVVLLSLAIWGALWGIPGMFLSAPLTVLLMILCSQWNGARWLAIALSADGRPTTHATENVETAQLSQTS